MSHDLCESLVRKLEAPEGQVFEVGCHTADLVKEDVLEPIAVLKIEFLSLMSKVHFKVLFSEDCLGESLKVFSRFKNLILS